MGMSMPMAYSRPMVRLLVSTRFIQLFLRLGMIASIVLCMNHDSFAPTLSQLPKVPFPTFDGDNPKLWQKRCADYFFMYSVHPRVWIHIATMHFSDAAARWL